MTMQNGTKNWVIKWLVGALWGLLVLALATLTNNVIANDKESRDRDDHIKESVEKKIEHFRKEQQVMRKESNEKFTQILVSLAELKQR